MSASIKDLKAELQALQTQRAAIDLAPLRAAFEAAKVAKSAHKSPSNSFAVDPVERALSVELSAAENAYDNARYLTRDFDRLIAPLLAMLESPQHAAAARADLDGLQAQAAAASAAVASAAATVDVLRGQLADAAATLASDREHTAQALLTAAKQGKALTPTTPDRGPVLAIESALALAESEHDTARQTLDDLNAQIREAENDLRNAQTNAANLQFEIVVRDFVSAVVQHRETVRGYNPEQSDIMRRVRAAEHARGAS